MSDIYREISKLLSEGRRGALATVIGASGSTPGKESAKMLIREDGTIFGTIGGGCTEADVWALAREAIERDVPIRRDFELTPKTAEEEGLACGGIVEIFIEPLGSPVVHIFGAGHIARQLAPLVHLVGMKCVIIDDRPQFADSEHFPPDSQVLVAGFEDCFERLNISPASFIVIVTRGHKYDHLVLSEAIRTSAGYIGLIGSKPKIARIYKMLREEGISQESLDEIHAPIGLDIGSRTPEEIAVSIAAELVAHRRKAYLKGKGRRLGKADQSTIA